MAELVHRPYRPGDEYAINDGFNTVFNQKRRLAEWHWKFTADDEARPIMLAVDPAGAVMVHYGAIPVRIQVDGRDYAAGEIVDVYSRQEARTGLAAARAYLRNYDRFVETFCGPNGLAFCYGFPGDRALRLGVKRTYYDDIPPGAVGIVVRDPRRRPRRAPRFAVLTGFEATAVDAVWQRCRQRYEVAVVRDARYVGRRYLGRPGVEYTHLVVWHRGRPEAVAVVRADTAGVRLAELLWDGSHAAALAAVDRRVVDLANRWRTTRIEMWLEADAEALAVFARLGWSARPHPENLHWVVRVFHPDIDPDRIPGGFYFTLGDSDLV